MPDLKSTIVPDLKSTLLNVATGAEERFDNLKRRLQERFGKEAPWHIVPYRGFGTPTSLRIKGRVLEGKRLKAALDGDSSLDNLLAAIRRYESDEIPGVRVLAKHGKNQVEVVTDEEGYFDVELVPEEPPRSDVLWHDVTLTLPEAPSNGEDPVSAIGKVMVPPKNASFGVISDVDDTVLQTNATDLLRMARLTFLENARTRLPFDGVASFYRALHRGTGGSKNPLFYVSSSPWNLYDFLVEFMEQHDIPAGPLLLRDLGLDRTKFIKSGHHQHKIAQIESILSSYPDLPFILLGDSGQEDPEIYRTVVQDYPGRILSVYIREVSSGKRDKDIAKLAEEVLEQEGELLLVPDSRAAAAHAVTRGFVADGTVEDIDKELARKPEGTEV